jgi:hypothetical protein
MQGLGHGHEGRDADAGREQQARARALAQGEVVARRRDLQRVAFGQRVVHRGRAATAAGLAQHGDPVRAGLAGGVAQRVLAHRARGRFHVDVRAGGEGGQRCTFTLQVQQNDVLGFRAFAGDLDHEVQAHRALQLSRKLPASKKTGGASGSKLTPAGSSPRCTASSWLCR